MVGGGEVDVIVMDVSAADARLESSTIEEVGEVQVEGNGVVLFELIPVAASLAEQLHFIPGVGLLLVSTSVTGEVTIDRASAVEEVSERGRIV